MLRLNGPSIMELDERATSYDAPHGIITADCSGAHERDDGLAVMPLPSAQEAYHVEVATVDTSPLFRRPDIRERVLERTESLYGAPGTELETYHPLLPVDETQRRHFQAGRIRPALMIGFNIGENLPPSDVTVRFGEVAIMENLNYNEFGIRAHTSPEDERFGRAAAYIFQHLREINRPLEAIHAELMQVPPGLTFRRGSTMNAAYMIAANFLGTGVIRDDGYPVIHRVFNKEKPPFPEILEPNIAAFSFEPDRHDGLSLPWYGRLTSPLRRAEDFAMLVVARARAEARPLSLEEDRFIRRVVQRLNQRVVYHAYIGQFSANDRDSWRPNPTDEAIELSRTTS